MPDPIVIVPYDPNWINMFNTLGKKIRYALSDTAIRIDHIGSTAIPNIAAKPIIDVQISVANFDKINDIEKAMSSIGFEFRKHNPDISKRYFRETTGNRRTHIHIRRSGSFGEILSLLFRDYLRQHPTEMILYEDVKYKLVEKYKYDRLSYTDGKSDIIWEIIRNANKWSQDINWYPKDSDA